MPQTTFKKREGDNVFNRKNNNEGNLLEKKKSYNYTKSKLPQKLVDLQVYQQNSSSGKKHYPKPDISVYGPINTGGFNPPYQYGNYGGMPYPLIKPYNPNIVKKYVIDNSMLGSKDIDTLFETVVPKSMLDFRKISNRLAFCHFIKTNLIKEDGDYIKLHGTGNTLLSHVKPVEPKNMGNDLIIYKSCYPIQLDKRFNNIECSSKSAGINLRVYSKSNSDNNIQKEMTEIKKTMAKNDNDNFNEMSNKLHENLNKLNKLKLDSEVQEDIQNMIKIRDEIIKKYISPHFIMTYGYNITKGDINNPNSTVNSLYRNITYTESPNYKLKDWAGPSYFDDGLVKSANKQGVYSKHLWEVAIFQILTIFLLKERHDHIKKMKIDIGNIYVKTIKSGGYWKYNINNLELYVPNYGFIILVQSNFDNDAFKNNKNINIQLHDLVGEIEKIKEIPEEIKKELKTILNNFKVTKKLDKKIINSSNIFHNFMHNKIGLSIGFFKHDETFTKDRNKISLGDIIGYQDGNEYKYGVIIEIITKGQKFKIIQTLNKNSKKEKEVEFKDLYQKEGSNVFIFNKVNQNLNSNKVNFSYSNLIETYKIGNSDTSSNDVESNKNFEVNMNGSGKNQVVSNGGGFEVNTTDGKKRDEIIYNSETDEIIM
jgi:hypothetical protein